MASFWQGVANFVATGIVVAAGKSRVQQIVQFKTSAAIRAVEQLADEVVRSQNIPMMAAILDEFGNQLQAAGTRLEQDEVNDLLWRFKERFFEVGGAQLLDTQSGA